MRLTDHFALLARYNQWMNEKLYAAAAGLPGDAVMEERGAFFGSLFGTLSHLVVADTIWLKRFAAHPAQFPALEPMRGIPMPARLDERPCPDLPALHRRRRELDEIVLRWTEALDEPVLAQPLEYRTMKGDPHRKTLSLVLLHFFNHQAHHRGQATTLFSQAGVDVGVTDLLVQIPPAD